jgi:hypothetical protein
MIKTLNWSAFAAMLICTSALALGIEELHVKKESVPSQGFTSTKTYRGSRVILLEMAIGTRRTRAFCVDGKAVAVEEDKNGDGFFEELTGFGKNGDFEVFNRGRDGAITPLGSAELEDLRSKKFQADTNLSLFLETNGVFPYVTTNKGK